MTKEVKYLYDKDIKTLKKDTEDYTRRWKERPCSWIGRINTTKQPSYKRQLKDIMKFLSKFKCNSLLKKKTLNVIKNMKDS